MPSRRRKRSGPPHAGTAPPPRHVARPMSSATGPLQARPPGIERIDTPEAAERLAGRLLDPSRGIPVVVITTPSGRDEPWIDTDEVADAVLGLADVVVMPTDSTSWRFSELMPPGTQVFGGAGRAYPLGLEWISDLSRSPLRFAYGPADRTRATDGLISDALAMTAASTGATDTPVRPVTGTVSMLVAPSRAIVKLDDDGLGTVWQELTIPGVPIDHLLTRGQRVSGLLDPVSRRVDIRMMLVPAPDAARYEPGDVVLGRVEEVRPDVVHIALHPGVVVPVPKHRVTSNPLDAMTELFSPGETVVARVAWRDEERPALRLDDIDDDEAPLPAPPVLVDGPPWLTVPTPEPALVEEDRAQDAMPSFSMAPSTESRAAPTRTPPTPRDLPGGGPVRVPAPRSAVSDALLEDTRRQAEAFRMRAETLEARLRDLEAKVREQKTALRREKLRQKNAGPRGLSGNEAEQRFEYEVYLAWRDRIQPADRVRLPLAEYSLGAGFIESVESLDGVDRRKVVDVTVEVLTGLAKDLDGRELHRLRASASGGSPPLTREGGWTAWRVALQRNTPSARRLHFWRRGDEFELARVVLHDEVRA